VSTALHSPESRNRRPAARTILWLTLLALAGLGAYLGGRSLWANSYWRAALRAEMRADFRHARADLAVCLEHWPDSAAAHWLAARVQRRAALSEPLGPGWVDEASRHLAAARRLGYPVEEIQLEQALLDAQTGGLAGVEEYLTTRLRRQDADAPVILEALTATSLESYQLPRALRCATEWLDREPDNVRALYWRGITWELLFSPQRAIADLTRVLELDPGHDGAHRHLARQLTDLKRDAEVESHYEHLQGRGPGDAEVLVGLARCRHAAGRVEEARQLLDRVLEADPDCAPALAERGKIALDADALGEAERLLRKAVALAPADAQTNYNLSRCLQRLGRNAEADRYRAEFRRIEADWKRLREVIRLMGGAPRTPGLCAEAGTILLRNGRDALGLAWLSSALKEDPLQPAAHQALADYYERTGKTELARHHRGLARSGAVGPGPGP
jgi:tetratricopeptide (TPR) repeat protein